MVQLRGPWALPIYTIYIRMYVEINLTKGKTLYYQ